MSSSRRGGGGGGGQPSSGSGGDAGNRSKRSARMVAQTSVDAKLNQEFEEAGSSFDYSRSVAVSSSVGVEADEQPQSKDTSVATYLHQIQKGKLIQPYGCLLALDEKSLKVMAYSENASEMLTMVSHAVPSIGEQPILGIGTDLRTIFTTPSVATLHKASSVGDVSLLNPILVHCKTSGKPFYAIVHRVTGSLIVDFEPVKPLEVPMTAAGALQSYKLAAKAISRLQSLPSGSMERLVDTVVQEVFELTGYDRVMAYKFHEDDHGEVISEVTAPDLDPYLGLHYPATDIPQAARFLFMKNKVRLICDCHAKPVKVYQDEKLPFDLTLCGSTLRAPHSCHLHYMANMGSVASLVMAVVINEGATTSTTTDHHAAVAVGDHSFSSSSSAATAAAAATAATAAASDATTTAPSRRKMLWGLVVCHNTKPRFVPFPLRYACEFLMQVFAIHVNKELELERQIREKNILRTQTLLCDMLLRDAPMGIVNQSPNIMDLIKCDGAALLYKHQVFPLGVAPSDAELRQLARWLSSSHRDSTGLSTDSLHDAGYPNASCLGNVVCGMAAVKITSSDMLFWFRRHTAAEVRWGGAKHHPTDRDDGKRMHPRSSFKAFLEVVKNRSLPWQNYEMDAIHSLQLILRASIKEPQIGDSNDPIQTQLGDLKIGEMDELHAVTSEVVRLIETATVPIFAVDVDGLINGWNAKISELTGTSLEQVMGKHLLSLVEYCSITVVRRMLYLALQGEEEQNVEFLVKSNQNDRGPLVLVVNACASRDIHGNVVGVCFVAQDMTGHRMVMDKFTRIEGDYKSIVQNPNPLIPPIFGADEFGWCSEWNSAMEKTTGWKRDEVMDKMLLGEVFGIHLACCRLKSQDSFVTFGVVLNSAMMGQDTEKVQFGFFGRSGKYVECLLSMNKKVDREGIVRGVFCFLHITSHELQQALHVQKLLEQTAMRRSKVLAYMRQEMKNPLSGIMFARNLLEGTELCEEQKHFLGTSLRCQQQLTKVLSDFDLDSIIEGYLDMEMVVFTLQDVLDTAVSQVMIPSEAKCIHVIQDYTQGTGKEQLYGDNLRLQQILADFLYVVVKYTPAGGQIHISIGLVRDNLGQTVQLAHMELRITHSGTGIPEELLSQMFENDGDASEDGICLLISRKLLRLMNGDVQYLREATGSSFIISVELAAAI